MKDYYPVERFYRDARLGTIGGGTSEIMQFLIQREVYQESKSGRIPSQKTFPETELDFDTFMSAIPKGFRADRAEGVTARIQFLFEDKEPWLLTIHDQQCSIANTEVTNQDMTVRTDSGTWQDIMLSKIDAMQAMMTSRITVDTDDMDLLMKFARMFKFTPEILLEDH